MKPFIIVISGPSGVGKTTLISNLHSQYPNIQFAVSATTRNKREGEVNGKDYFFITRTEFENKIKNNEFIEYTEKFGNLYGTLKSEIDSKLKAGNLLLDIDYQGFENLKKSTAHKIYSIFILPPSMDELKERLLKRDAHFEIRYNNAIEEMKHQSKYDFQIVNQNLSVAIQTICNLYNNLI